MLLFLSGGLFGLAVVVGVALVVAGVSWFSVWAGLELNLLAFIPLVFMSRGGASGEAGLKYFLVQAYASVVVLQSGVFLQGVNLSFSVLLVCALLMKMGSAPFHFWFPMVSEGLEWGKVAILFTLQKISPLVLLYYCYSPGLEVWFCVVALFSASVGAFGGMGEVFLRKLLSFSSISHSGWMVFAMVGGSGVWVYYFCLYSFLVLNLLFLLNKHQMMHFSHLFLGSCGYFSQTNISLWFLSLGGVPPLLGFLPKWVILQSVLSYTSFVVLLYLLMASLITVYYYLRVGLCSFFVVGESKKFFLAGGGGLVEVSLGGVNLWGLGVGSLVWYSLLR